MSDLDQTIAMFQAKLRPHEKEVARIRGAINLVCELHGRPPMYPEDAPESDVIGLSIRSDQFYGQPLAAAIRTVLEMRKKLNSGPATVNEIYDSLQQGGFAFDTKNDENAKRGLRISLSKNTAVFHKLPNGKFGLLEWYPNAKTPKKARGVTDLVSEEEEEEDEDVDEL
jgi:hypothetical protein